MGNNSKNFNGSVEKSEKLITVESPCRKNSESVRRELQDNFSGISSNNNKNNVKNLKIVSPNNKVNSSNTNVKEAIENRNERMKQISHMHESCVRNIEREKNRQVAYYNKGKREYTFEVGQQVWKKKTKLSSKAKGYSAKLGR